MPKLCLPAFAIATLIPLGAVAADVADTTPTAADEKVEEIESVTVTGRKPLIDNTHEPLGAFGNKDAMEIPLSIQSVSAVMLENTRARTLIDVTSSDPSVQDGRVGGSYSNLRIRGFSTDWTNTIRRDGLSLAPYQDVPLEGVEQVTVLKGPSGFLYGFNSPGGTVNYITKRPTKTAFNEATVEGRTDGGWYGHLETSNTLMQDTLGYRLNAGYEDVGDFTKNFDFNRHFVTGSVDWKINDLGVLQLNADWQKKEVAAQPIIGISTGKLPPMYDPTTLLGQPWLQYSTNAYNVGSRFDYQLSENWSVTAQLAFSANTRFTAQVRLSGARDNGDVVQDSNSRLDISPDQSYRTESGQVFVTGKFDTSILKHELVTGFSGVNYKALESGYVKELINVGNIFDPVYSAQPDLPATLPGKNHNDVKQLSPFASDLISLGDHLEALVGARYIHFKNTLRVPGSASAEYIRSAVVPNYGLIYKFNEGFMVYGDYTRGLEQSGVAPSYATNAGITLAPLKSTQYEVGAKARVFDRFNVGLAAFEITKTLEYVNDALLFEQDGRQRHRGIELSGSGLLLPNLNLSTGVSRLWTTQFDTNDPTVNGSRTPNAPNWQFSTTLDYGIPAVRGLFVDGTLQYVDNRAVNASNTVVAPGFTTFDLGARYATLIFDLQTVVRFNVRNVANRRYWASAESNGVFPGTPRTAYLSASVDF